MGKKGKKGKKGVKPQERVSPHLVERFAGENPFNLRSKVKKMDPEIFADRVEDFTPGKDGGDQGPGETMDVDLDVDAGQEGVYAERMEVDEEVAMVPSRKRKAVDDGTEVVEMKRARIREAIEESAEAAVGVGWGKKRKAEDGAGAGETAVQKRQRRVSNLELSAVEGTKASATKAYQLCRDIKHLWAKSPSGLIPQEFHPHSAKEDLGTEVETTGQDGLRNASEVWPEETLKEMWLFADKTKRMREVQGLGLGSLKVVAECVSYIVKQIEKRGQSGGEGASIERGIMAEDVAKARVLWCEEKGVKYNA